MLSEYRYQPADPEQLPYGPLIGPVLRECEGHPVLLNHGAIASLEALLGLLADGAPLLVNDYGNSEGLTCEGFEHQRFAQSTSVGLNFTLLRRHFAEGQEATWAEPAEGDAPIHARLLARAPAQATLERFAECFSEAARTQREAPARQGRELVQAGRFRAALSAFREALALQPLNWALMAEASQVLTSGLRDPASGAALARCALEHNPACSADLWDCLGEALAALGNQQEAERAFRRALQLSPRDARAAYNLACLHAARGEDDQALQRVAEGLCWDQHGGLREALLHKQTEVLASLQRRSQQRYLDLANRIIRPDLPGYGAAKKPEGRPLPMPPRP